MDGFFGCGVVIIGGVSGIGLVIGIEFVCCGVRVVLGDVDKLGFW